MINSRLSKIEDELNNSGYVIYYNVGKSMLPLIRQKKDLVTIKKSFGKFKKRDIVLYKSNGRLVLHRILEVKENEYVICGDSCTHKEFGIKNSDILGVMTSLSRNGKEISMNSPIIKIYSFLICNFFPVKVFAINTYKTAKRILNNGKIKQ